MKIKSNNGIFRFYYNQQINKTLKNIIDKMDEAIEEFYKTNKKIMEKIMFL